MPELDPLELTTRQEKIIAVAAALGSVFIHIVIIVGAYRDFWPNREDKKKQLMIVHRIPDRPSTAAPAPADSGPPRKVYSRSEATVVEKGKKPENRERNRPPEPGPVQSESEKQEALPEQPLGEVKKPNTVTIYTDLNEAFFRLEGPASYKGAGTFWERKDLPTGEYKVTFGTVEGYQTPEPQTGILAKEGNISFVGRYTKMTQVMVDVNMEGNHFKIIRPDGHYLDMKGNRQGLFKDLPEGAYTIVFEDLPGLSTPGPQSQTLGRGGGMLRFSGYYGPGGTGTGGRGSGGSGEEPARLARARTVAPPREAKLDRRVRMVVTSYPGPRFETPEELSPPFIVYPETILRKSDYQEGWCQVYLILSINVFGDITLLRVERPAESEQPRYASLIEAVEKAVRTWVFQRQEAEVHVDARFYVER